MLIAGGIGINSSSSSSTLLASPSALHPRRARGKPCIVCSACKPTTVLPNGLEVCYASKYDVSFLYREIFEEQTYLQHGIHLAEGNVVVDVGGNIGFFAMFAAATIGPSGTVISAEPIPTLYEKLCYNIISHKAWSLSQGVSAADIVPLPVGVGSGKEKMMQFTFFPAAAGWSTMYPDEEEVQSAMHVFLERSLGKLQGLDSSWLTTAGQLLQRTAPKWLTQKVERAFVANMWQNQQKHECAMKTVSDIVQDHSLSRIDLLKIDVERAELDVLLGISKTDWKLISQVVLEVHDVQGRLEHILQLLKNTAGFTSVTVTQDGTLTGSTLYNIYCSRSTTGIQSAKVLHKKQTT